MPQSNQLQYTPIFARKYSSLEFLRTATKIGALPRARFHRTDHSMEGRFLQKQRKIKKVLRFSERTFLVRQSRLRSIFLTKIIAV